jgi:RNA polymerase sigma factor (sigma-70 family)
VKLFELWYDRLVASVRRRLDDRDDAEDVAQEAFVRLLGEETPRDPPAWLFAVAGRLVIDRQRAAARRARIAARLGPELVVDDSAERAETVAMVRAVLAQLPERDRQLLLLHHDGASYREIAARLGLSPASIGSLLTRAHRRFLAAHDARAPRQGVAVGVER